MTAASPSSSPTLLLQRRLSSGDCSKWKTVLRCTPKQLPAVESWVAAARLIDCAVSWRIARADGLPFVDGVRAL